MSEGLEGVIAARTVLSDVDGAAGRLVIRGYSLDQLAGRTRFAEAAHLLMDGFLKTCRTPPLWRHGWDAPASTPLTG